MGDMMNFPKTWELFLHDYEFEDARRIYTNGSRLIPSFRVKQMVEHYFRNFWVSVKDRMPENHQRVLAFGRDNIVHDMIWNWSDDCWTDKITKESYMERFITHWMPLPEAPEVE